MATGCCGYTNDREIVGQLQLWQEQTPKYMYIWSVCHFREVLHTLPVDTPGLRSKHTLDKFRLDKE